MTNELEVRQEIDESRDRLGQTVDAIGDRIVPARVIERRKDRMKSRIGSWRDRVMGSASESGDHVATAAHAVRDAPSALAERSQGSPLVAGATAFGVGLLIGSLWRPTPTERQLASKVGERAPGVIDEARSVAQELTGTVKDQAVEAADELRHGASEAADSVKQAATSGANGDQEELHQGVLADRPERGSSGVSL